MKNDVRSDQNKVSGSWFRVSGSGVLSLGKGKTNDRNVHYQTQDKSVLGSELRVLEKNKTRKEIQQELARIWPELKKQFEFIGRYASKDRIVEAITVFSEARKSRFLRRRTPKYGSMDKGFEEHELKKFFSVVDDPRLALLFKFQAVLGLRIGEAVKIHIKDINLKTRKLKIQTEKSKTLDFLLIPEQLFTETINYNSKHETSIVKAGGYLFFTENRHLSASFAMQAFHRYIRKAGLFEVYGYSNDPKPRTLSRITTHSLRHTAITNHAKY